MTPTDIKLQVGVKVFLKNKEGKFLLVRRSAAKYGTTQGSWDIVGGRINPGSGLIENLRREVQEETGLEIVSAPKLIAAQDIIPNPEKHVVRLTYIASAAGEVVLDMSENVEYAWLTVDEIRTRADLDAYVADIMKQGLVV